MLKLSGKNLLVLSLLLLSACQLFTAAGRAMGIIPSDSPMNQLARQVDGEIANWFWWLLGGGTTVAAAELTPVKPIRRTINAIKRRHRSTRPDRPSSS